MFVEPNNSHILLYSFWNSLSYSEWCILNFLSLVWQNVGKRAALDVAKCLPCHYPCQQQDSSRLRNSHKRSLPCLPPACKFQLRPADEHRAAGTAWHKFWIWFRSPVMLGQWILRWNPTTPLAVLTLCSEHFNLTSVILKSMMAAGKILYGSHYVKAVQIYFIFHCVVPQLWFPDKMLLVCAMFPDLPRLEKDVYSEAAAAAAKSL